MSDRQIVPGDLFARAQTIAGLRQLADYLEANPEVPVDEYGWDASFFPRGTDDERRAQVDHVAALLGVPVSDETRTGGHYIASKTFGRITYRVVRIPPPARAAHAALMSYAPAFKADQADQADQDAA